MQYAVRTLAPDMSIGSVLVDASDEADARHQVEQRGLVASAVRPAGVRALGRGAGRFSLLLFSQELLALLAAGLGIVEAIEALLDKETAPSTRAVLERLLGALREGQRFSGALAAQPALFPPLYVGIVRAAEGTSDLPRSLGRYIDYQQRLDLVRTRVVSAAIYPAILLCVGAGVSAFLVGYVVPRFAEVYHGAGRELPWLSQLMLDWGQFASRHGLLLSQAALGMLVLGALVLRRQVRSGTLAALLARLPGIGERVRIYELSRLYLTLGMLAEGGITIVGAIDTVGAMASPALKRALASAREAVVSGMPLSAAFDQAGLATPISLRLLRVGERTGDMGPMLMQSAAFYDGEIGRWIDRFTRSFEPLLMAAIGIVVGAIVVLLYMPIFDLAGDMG